MAKAKKIQPKAATPIVAAIKKETEPSFLSKFLLPENIFLVLGFTFGLLFLITIPPFQIPDESVHFKRAYKLSTFDIFQTETKGDLIGDYMPTNLDSTAAHFSYLSFRPYNKTNKRAILREFKYKINYDSEQFVFNSASNYFFFSYLPEMPVMFIMRQFDVSILSIFYMGRICSLLFFLFVVWYVIKITPFGKHIILVLALLPNTLQMAGSWSSDNCSNVFTFLAIGLILNLTQTASLTFREKKVWIFVLVCAIIGTIKPIYFPISLLGLVIPSHNFNDRSNWWLFNSLCIVFCIAFTGVWTYLISTVNVAPVEFASTGVDPRSQLYKIILSPMEVLQTAKNTFQYFWTFYCQSSIGILGYLDTLLKPWVYTTFYVLILLVATFDINNRQISFIRSLFIVIVGMGIIFAAFLGLYVYTVPSDKIVSGIQGRYFTPGLICIFVSVSTFFKFSFQPFKYKISLIVLSVTIFFILFSVQGVLYARYYR